MPNRRYDEKMGLRLSSDQRARVEKIAKRTESSMGDIVRRVLNVGLPILEEQVAQAERHLREIIGEDDGPELD